MTGTNDIHLPDPPTSSDVKVLLRFCADLHATAQRILIETRLNRTDIDHLQLTLEPPRPHKTLWQTVDEHEAAIGRLDGAIQHERTQRNRIMWYLVGIGVTSFIGLLAFLGRFIFEQVMR